MPCRFVGSDAQPGVAGSRPVPVVRPSSGPLVALALAAGVVGCAPDAPDPSRLVDISPPPEAPGELTVTPVSSTALDITWTPPGGDGRQVSSYNVYRDDAPVASVDEVRHLDEGLDPFTEYEYTVSALNEFGLEGERSVSARARTLDGSPPLPPQSLSGQGVSATQVNLTWSAASDPETGIDGYRVYRNDELAGTTSGATSFSDTGLDPATEYTYEIAAVNGDELEGERSSAVVVSTGSPDDATPPTAPTGLSADPAGPSQVDLTWSAASDPESGISGYRIYRDGARVGTTGGDTEFTDTGLEPATEYRYEVSAVNGDGVEGARSGPATATTTPADDMTPPSTPTGLSATAVSPSQVDLTWSAASDPESGVEGYMIYRDGEAVGTTSGNTRFSDTGLQASTTYVYQVSALNGDGLEGQRSTPVEVTTPRSQDPSPPTTPGGLRATAVTGTQVNLAWSAASDPQTGVASYRVYRNGAFVSSVPVVASPSFTDVGLTRFTEYTYEVSAVNGDGVEGGRSGPAVVRTPDDSPPSRPTDLTGDASGTEVSLTWSAASDPESGISGYRIYRDGSPVDDVQGTSFTDTGLQPATTHTYEVSAINGDGLEGPRSASEQVTTTDATPPSAPTGLTATLAGPTDVDLDWTAASDPESGVSLYRIYRDGAQIDETAATEYTDSGLDPSTDYRYEVSAVNGAGLEGPRSSAATVTTSDVTPPSAPDRLDADAEGSTEVELAWKKAEDRESGIASYRIYRDGAPVATTDGDDTDFTDTGLTPATTYAYEVSAVNGEGLEGPKSSAVTVTTDDDSPPDDPDDLTAAPASATQIDLSWSAATDPETGISGYRVYRDGARVQDTPAVPTRYSDTDLSPFTPYSYRVSAVNGHGQEGPMSPSVLVRTADGTPPTTPSNVSAGATGSTQVIVSWTASTDPETGIAGYRVFRNGTPVGSMTPNTFFSDSDLTPSTTYSYEVSAVNGEGLESARGGAPPVTTLSDTRFSTSGDPGAQALAPAAGSSP